MRRILKYISIFTSFLLLEGCNDFLELEPFDRVSAEQLFASSGGIKTVLANIYNLCPIEDFNYVAAGQGQYSGFNRRLGGGDGATDGGWSLATATEEMLIDPGGNISPDMDAYQYWDYAGIRQVNKFLETITSLNETRSITEDTYNHLKGDAHFIRAYMYFQLARRYGGVPIIEAVQNLSDEESTLFVPRSTEKQTWDFVMSECDRAIANLPEIVKSDEGAFRATKWAALALKSRAALYAASIAKYWDKAPLTGEAVIDKLVGGMTIEDANNYYLLCINASKNIIDNSGKQLYKPEPANKAEAADNYQNIFETPSLADVEVIFAKHYIDGVGSSGQHGHNTDYWFYPMQSRIQTTYRAGRISVTLDIVDVYEDYTDDGTGRSAPVATRSDGVENYVELDPKVFNPNLPFRLYDAPYDIFANKDARLDASVILPGSIFRGKVMVMQGGMVLSDGTPIVYADHTATGLDGKTYYSYGAESAGDYSAFAYIGGFSANYSSTGFALRKFLQDRKNMSTPALHGSTQPWIDFRLAEIYLNYAEACIESNQGDPILASEYLNAIRRRAAHTDQIPPTIENIIKERRVELAFEGHRYWDLKRRREYHTAFNVTKRKSLLPILDLRQNPPKYLFLRAVNYYDHVANGRTFIERNYYLAIPGVASNRLIQNPGY